MSLIDKLKSIGSEWIFKVAVKRTAAAISGAIIGLLADQKIADFLVNSGVEITQEKLKAQVVVVFTAGVVALHDWLRLKVKWL